jgi:hypothetical protein
MQEPLASPPRPRRGLRFPGSSCEEMARVPITGASCGIGLAATDLALERGHSVIAFARSAHCIPIDHAKLRIFPGDTREPDDMREALSLPRTDTCERNGSPNDL